MKKIAIVDIMGGFGNQLFAICFGLQLQNNGFKVYYYFSDNKNSKEIDYNPSNRQLVINPKKFGIKKLRKFHIYLLKFFKKNYKIIFENEINTSLEKVFPERYTFITSFNGQFQDCLLYENNKELIDNIILNDKINKTFNLADCGYISSPSNKPEVVLKDFKMMINSKNFIVGNSTFSLFASLIGHEKDSIIVIDKNFYENIKNIKYFSENVYLI